MAVLIEAISLVVRQDAIDRYFRGGSDEFFSAVPNSTFCTDGELARVGFMSPDEVQDFAMMLEGNGLVYLQDGEAIHFTVVDQQRGPMAATRWLEFARIPFGGTGKQVAAAWLFEGLRMAEGIHLPSGGLKLAVPDDWEFEGSLSAEFVFVENEGVEDRLEFLRHEDGMSVFRDCSTGKLVYLGGKSAGE